MIEVETLLLFVPVALALNITPGADMLFCLGQGLRSGPRAGVAASFGIAAGSFLHSLAGGLGLAALIAAHPLAFETIRWAGVCYLLYLAIRSFVAPAIRLEPGAVDGMKAGQAFRHGVLVSLLNPKVAIFILALVPQFVDPGAGSVLVQFLILGLVFNIGGTVVNLLIGAFAGGIGGMLARNRRAAQALQYLSGFVFVGLAAKLAFERRG